MFDRMLKNVMVVGIILYLITNALVIYKATNSNSNSTPTPSNRVEFQQPVDENNINDIDDVIING